HLLIPLAFMIYVLGSGLTPTYGALSAILTSLIVHSLQWLSLVPIGFMLIALNLGMRAQLVALTATGIWLLICLVRRRLGFDPRDIVDALVSGARNVLAVAVACAMAGMIVGSVTMTGLGLKFANALAALAGNNLLLMMFFTMLASI